VPSWCPDARKVGASPTRPPEANIVVKAIDGPEPTRWTTSCCHCGQPWLPIVATGHIDGVGDSLNDGITSHRGELGTRFASN
jgi:hypothetical protein